MLFESILNSLKEGHVAANLSSDLRSSLQLRYDFLASRLLKWFRIPGCNQERKVGMDGLTLHYRLNRGDLQSLKEVVLERVYEIRSLISRPKTFLDLGANIGLTSVWFAHHFSETEPGFQFEKSVAVEPVPENARVARLNFRSNELNTTLIEAAVGMGDGEAWFETRAASNLGSVSSAPTHSTECIRVPIKGIKSILDLFPDRRVDLVKMDIEGAEGDLLSGNPRWLENVGALIVEWHDERTDSAPLIQNVEKIGFSHRRINESRQENLSLFVRV